MLIRFLPIFEQGKLIEGWMGKLKGGGLETCKNAFLKKMSSSFGRRIVVGYGGYSPSKGDSRV